MSREGDLVRRWRAYLERDDLTPSERDRAKEQMAWAEQRHRSAIASGAMALSNRTGRSRYR